MESIYGEHLPELLELQESLMGRIGLLRRKIIAKDGVDPVEHCLTRIKTEESMRAKCRSRGLPETADSALYKIYDAVGLRIVCTFLDDVYMIRDYLRGFDDLKIENEKDYIRNVKPNGYRSLHLILRAKNGFYAEIQLRTISMDTWAALEHQLKYKRDVSGNEELIVSELKRCADELASTDVSMQTIRNLIRGEI